MYLKLAFPFIVRILAAQLTDRPIICQSHVLVFPVLTKMHSSYKRRGLISSLIIFGHTVHTLDLNAHTATSDWL
jgi:hypothetical protein